jgi:DNA-binding winged helix-turn-helix (wHTH) protein
VPVASGGSIEQIHRVAACGFAAGFPDRLGCVMGAGSTWRRSQDTGRGLDPLDGNPLASSGRATAPHVVNGVAVPLGGTGARQKASIPARCVSFGDFEMDLQEQQLLYRRQPVKIQGKVYQALLVLVETPGELVTREQLRNRLWPRDAHLNYDANVNTTVNKLRQILGDTSDSASFIQTIPRRGYCFIAKVGYADAPTMVETAGSAHARGKADSRGGAGLPGFLRSERARIWFTASVVTWIAAAVLFASAIIVYAHRAAHAQSAGAGAGAGAGARSTPEMATTP